MTWKSIATLAAIGVSSVVLTGCGGEPKLNPKPTTSDTSEDYRKARPNTATRRDIIQTRPQQGSYDPRRGQQR